MTQNTSTTNSIPLNSDNVYVIMTISGKIIITRILLSTENANILVDPMELYSISDDTGTNLYFKPYMNYHDTNAVAMNMHAIESLVIAGENISGIYLKYLVKFKEQQTTETKEETKNTSKLH